MAYLVGECNQCGKCCLRESGVMIRNPMIEPHEDRCKSYKDITAMVDTGHCFITGRGDTSIEEVKDRFGKTITMAQIAWYNDNCPPYPRPQDKTPLPPECTITRVEA